MKNTLRVDFNNKRIIMDRTFAKNCSDTRSEEYAQLQRVRQDYPGYIVATRQIKKNKDKETYAGLTYAFMEDYIITHEKGENLEERFKEYNQLQLVAGCHSKGRRYPAIKKWFLAVYPEITKLGMLNVTAEGKDNPTLEVHSATQPEKAA